MISPRPVQYADPREKKNEMSEPSSADHSMSSCSEALKPASRLAAKSAVAQSPEPPPSSMETPARPYGRESDQGAHGVDWMESPMG